MKNIIVLYNGKYNSKYYAYLVLGNKLCSQNFTFRYINKTLESLISFNIKSGYSGSFLPVSYTHLDVYKRQPFYLYTQTRINILFTA